MPAGTRLLIFIEHGGYPLPLGALDRAGYEVQIATSVRQALKALRDLAPAAVMAEFNFNPRYGDRISNLESILAGTERLQPPPPLVVLGRTEDAHHIAGLQRSARGQIAAVLYPPYDPISLERALRAAGVPGTPVSPAT